MAPKKKQPDILTSAAQAIGSTLGTIVHAVTDIIHPAKPAKKKVAKKVVAKKRVPAKKKIAAATAKVQSAKAKAKAKQR